MTSTAIEPGRTDAAPTLTDEDRKRSRDRLRIASARAHHHRLRALLMIIGPGVLVMLGENDGPSMLSYAASGATYGVGFFLPFIVVTFAVAVFVQNMSARVGAATHRGFGELIFQRFGRFWGWVSCGDLVSTNLVTVISELVAIRVGLSFFGVTPWVSVAATVALVTISSFTGSFERWETVTLGLSVFNLIFIAGAVLSHPAPGAIGHAFATWHPLPKGTFVSFLLIACSDIGATVTPWMLFFQQSATVDKGLTVADLGESRIDTAIGGVVAAATGCAALVATAPFYDHHIAVLAQGGAAYAQALRPIVGHLAASLFALGLLEAGALGILTISASTAYALGESVPGGAHSFNDKLTSSRKFHFANIGLVLVAGLITLIPGTPLLSIALNANLLAVVLLPAVLVFLLLLANDHEIMGSAANGIVTNAVGIAITAVIVLAGGAYAVMSFLQVVR